MAKILVAENNLVLQRTLVDILKELKHQTATVYSLERLEELLSTNCYDLLIADRHLSGGDFYEILPELNLANQQIRCLLISQDNSLEHRLEAFNQGINDVLPKPFSLREFYLRINNLLFLEKNIQQLAHDIGNIRYYPHLGILEKDDQKQQLRPKEHKIFALLFRNRGLAVSREQLLSYIWPRDEQPKKNTLEVYVRRIRGKLFDQSHKLLTLRGLGYKLIY